jgi:hypothetical protein
MTIAIAISLSEGIVLAADSRTTRWRDAADHRWAEVVTDRAHKVFALGRHAAAVTHGRSHVRGHTIAALAGRYAAGRSAGAVRDAATVADELLASLGADEPAREGAPPREAVGFLVGAYGPDGVGRIYEAVWPAGERRLLSTTDAPNFHWRGQGLAITRLFKGIDPAMDLSAVDANTREQVANLEFVVPLRDMSLTDGVDLARFLGTITLGVARFVRGRRDGPIHPLVGGRLRVATLTPSGYRLAGTIRGAGRS